MEKYAWANQSQDQKISEKVPPNVGESIKSFRKNERHNKCIERWAIVSENLFSTGISLFMDLSMVTLG